MHNLSVRKKIRLPRAAYSQGHAFFITIGIQNKSPWFQKYPSLCEAAVKIMNEAALKFNIKVFAWCIMPDHVHFILQGEQTIEFIRQFKGKLTPVFRKIQADTRLWQRSFYDHALRKEESLPDVCAYTWENPVRAGIVDKAIDYLYSGSIVWPNWRGVYGRG